MKYEAKIGERKFEIEVEGETIRLGARSFTGRLVTIPGSPLRRIAVNGLSRTYAMSRSRDGWEIQRDGRIWTVEITDERTRSLRRLLGQRRQEAQGGMVRAPMPGLVLRLEVEEGRRVTVGSGLLVLEAMKMENEIRAGIAGVVKRILVRAGEAVEKGADLLEIESGQG